jgi:hypothetical protein
MNNKQYLIICPLDVIIKNVDEKFTAAEFDFGYKPFNETDTVINHVDLAVITPEDKTLVRSWFDESFYQPPCLIELSGNNAIENIINAWGKKRAEGHILLLGNDLTGYATADIPCIVFDQEPLFYKEHCFCIDGG